MIFEFFFDFFKSRFKRRAKMGLRRSSRIKQQQAEHKRLARSNTCVIFIEILLKQLIELFSSRKKTATNVKKDEKQQQQKT